MRKISKLTIEEITQAATLVYSNRQYRRHFFPKLDTVEQLMKSLGTPGEEWHVIDSTAQSISR